MRFQMFELIVVEVNSNVPSLAPQMNHYSPMWGTVPIWPHPTLANAQQFIPPNFIPQSHIFGPAMRHSNTTAGLYPANPPSESHPRFPSGESHPRFASGEPHYPQDHPRPSSSRQTPAVDRSPIDLPLPADQAEVNGITNSVAGMTLSELKDLIRGVHLETNAEQKAKYAALEKKVINFDKEVGMSWAELAGFQAGVSSLEPSLLAAQKDLAVAQAQLAEVRSQASEQSAQLHRLASTV